MRGAGLPVRFATGGERDEGDSAMRHVRKQWAVGAVALAATLGASLLSGCAPPAGQMRIRISGNAEAAFTAEGVRCYAAGEYNIDLGPVYEWKGQINGQPAQLVLLLLPNPLLQVQVEGRFYEIYKQNEDDTNLVGWYHDSVDARMAGTLGPSGDMYGEPQIRVVMQLTCPR
jgi:hypothetical protein